MGLIRNIRSFPNWVEDILKIRARKTFQSIDLSKYNASVEGVALSSNNNGDITVLIEMKPTT